MTTISALFAQQDPQFSMYMFNGQYINPAYVGSKGTLDLTAIYRFQWAGYDSKGAPHSVGFGVNTPFKKDQYAFGVYLGYDHIGYTSANSLSAQFAYRITAGNSKISLGVQGGFYHFNDHRTDAERIDDGDVIFNQSQSVALPTVGAGIHVYSDRYYVGVSLPHLLNFNISDRLHNAGANDNFSRQYRMIMATAGVVIGKEGANIKFKPSFLMKYQAGQVDKIPDFDINASLLFVDRFWLGTSLRTGGNIEGPYFSDVVGMFECLVTQQLRLGYSYDYPLSTINNFSSGSHEIMLGYQFGFEKSKFVNVRYGTYF